MGNKTIINPEFNTSPEFKTWLKEILHDEDVKDLRITFTKSDGTERVLHSTLAQNAIPTEKQPKSEATTRNASQDAQPVFDLDNGEWRSFRWDAVKSVEFSV